jgi:GntR family phosphonate transport system transcriptional regulator
MTRGTLWQQIEAHLRAEIAVGHYRPGDKLPTEAELSARFEVNRHTVRRALAAMQEAGLVHARRGAGVFVAAAPTDYRLGRRTRFRQNIEAAGQDPQRRLLRLETRKADPREAEVLALAPGSEVHVTETVGLADGVPMTLSASVFPAARFPCLPARFNETASVTAALAAEGLADYTRLWTRLTAERASPTQALHLRLPKGAPLLRSVALNVDPQRRPVEYGRTWFAGDRVQLVVEGG